MLSQLGRSRSSATPVAMNKSGAQILLSSIILQQEELGLFIEMSHSTTREGNMQDKHRASYHPECKECSRKEKKENEKKKFTFMGIYQRDTETN